jgi:signal transduction histidine kinase
MLQNQPPVSLRKKKRQFELFLLERAISMQVAVTSCGLAALLLIAQKHLIPASLTMVQGTILLLSLGVLGTVTTAAITSKQHKASPQIPAVRRRRLWLYTGAGFGLAAFSVFDFLTPTEQYSADVVLCAVTVVCGTLLYDAYEALVFVWIEVWFSAFLSVNDSVSRVNVTMAAAASLVLATLVSNFVRSAISLALSDQEESLSVAANLHAHNQHLKMFFLAANHDLAQPLTAIQFGLRSTNELTDPSSPIKQHVQIMLSASETLHRLIGDIVHYEKVASGRLDADATKASLQQVFDRVVKQTEQLAHTKNIGLWFRPTTRHLLSGAFIVERIVRNLVENAIKNTDGGRVLIAARPHGDTLRIEIWDTGVGIDTENIDRVFDLFYQNKTAAGRPPGHGIGLTIVRALTDEIGATIHVHTKPGRGTVFKLILAPTSCEQRKATTQSRGLPKVSIAGHGASWAGKVIAVLEDDYVLRSAICSSLAARGATVIHSGTTSGLLGELAGRESSVDILLTDWNLGPDTGETAAIALKHHSQFRGTWIVISGDISDMVRNRLSKAGVTIIRKPLSPEKLTEMIDQALLATQTALNPTPILL